MTSVTKVADQHHCSTSWGTSSISAIVPKRFEVVLIDHLGQSIQHQTVSSKVVGHASKPHKVSAQVVACRLYLLHTAVNMYMRCHCFETCTCAAPACTRLESPAVLRLNAGQATESKLAARLTLPFLHVCWVLLELQALKNVPGSYGLAACFVASHKHSTSQCHLEAVACFQVWKHPKPWKERRVSIHLASRLEPSIRTRSDVSLLLVVIQCICL